MGNIKKIKDEGYFCICDCGNISWMDESEEGNSIFNCLEKDGSMLIPRGLVSIKISQDDYFFKTNQNKSLIGKLFAEFTCAICEKKVSPIGFNKVNLVMRKEIAKMSPELRKEWLHNFKMVEELVKE